MARGPLDLSEALFQVSSLRNKIFTNSLAMSQQEMSLSPSAYDATKRTIQVPWHGIMVRCGNYQEIGRERERESTCG